MKGLRPPAMGNDKGCQAAPVDSGEKGALPGCADSLLMYGLCVSGLVVEGADGEIRRLREIAGRLTGQASPLSSIAMGGSRRRGRKRKVPRSGGSAAYREAESPGYFAP